MTTHQQLRIHRRKRWKKFLAYADDTTILASIKVGKEYETLRKYEKRKKQRYETKKRQTRNSTLNQHIPSTIPIFNNHGRLVIPSPLDFENNIGNIGKLTQLIDKHINSSDSKKMIDHSHIKSISIGGLLYLVGQMSKVFYRPQGFQKKTKYNKRNGLKSDDRIKYLFYKIGYWKYFDIHKPYPLPAIKDNYFLQMQTNTKPDFEYLNTIKDFIKANVDLIPEDSYKIEYQFDDAVKEAMANSTEHAYPDSFDEQRRKKGKWWICGHYDNLTKSLEIVFYDYGIGMQESTKRNLGEDAKRAFWDKARDKVKSDGEIIAIAVDGELSKYKNYKDHDRGKGFRRFKEFAKGTNYNCILTIASDKGKYKYEYDSVKKQETISTSKLPHKIEGMLIKWALTIKRKGNNNDV